MSDVRTFRLMRDIDHTGVSGPGRVADGVVWPDGTVTLRWVGDRPSTVNWAQLADAEYVHGHGGATRFVFDDADTPALASSEQRNGAVGRVQALLKREPGIFSRQEEADFRAVLAERDALAARVVELEGEREADVRAVDAFLVAAAVGGLQAAVEGDPFLKLRDHFIARIAAQEVADRTAALDADAARGGRSATETAQEVSPTVAGPSQPQWGSQGPQKLDREKGQ